MLESASRAAVRGGHMTDIKAQSIDDGLQKMTIAYYGCVRPSPPGAPSPAACTTPHAERDPRGWGPQVKIKTTPLPYAYSVHLRTLMIVYLVRPAPPHTRLQI